MLLSDKYPFLTNFFETAVSKNRLAHSLLFYGEDIESQYILAIELARFLNCSENKADDCECLNCKWIKDGKHPAVLTISRFDNKPDDDDSETVISVKQAEFIRNSIITTSDFHRVFIICDREEKEGKIKGLNKFNFQEATANSLLKSIEEPPERVTFIFLTRNKEDLISTIVSRCQCFFVPNKNRFDYNYDIVENSIKNYWSIKRAEAFNLSETFFKLTKEHSPILILEQIQNYMLSILKQNPKQRFLTDDINFVEKSKKEIIKGMKPEIVFDELCLNIIKQ